MEFVAAVRGSDVKRLRQLALEGRHMNACNKYGESIVHMACRRGDLEVLTFLVSTGAILDVADDFGRTPLHDACWTPEPRFDVVTFLLNKVCMLSLGGFVWGRDGVGDAPVRLSLMLSLMLSLPCRWLVARRRAQTHAPSVLNFAWTSARPRPSVNSSASLLSWSRTNLMTFHDSNTQHTIPPLTTGPNTTTKLATEPRHAESPGQEGLLTVGLHKARAPCHLVCVFQLPKGSLVEHSMSEVWWLPRSYIPAVPPVRNPPEDVESRRRAGALLRFTPTPSGPQLYYTHCA